MSAPELHLTNPVPVGGHASHQHWPTPRWVVDALIAHGEPRCWWQGGADVLDPACGEGAILDVWRERGLVTRGYEIDPVRATIARERGHQVVTDDALQCDWSAANLLVMNPPYGSEAGKFVSRAMAWLAEQQGQLVQNRRVCALLYINFVEPAADRGPLFRATSPDVLVLPRRPRFDGRGTNSAASCWFCWPGTGNLVWLP